MKEFKNKVAVITGAAGGIGKGIAERCVQEGMKVVLADVQEDALVQTEKELKAVGADILAVPTDVSKRDDMERLAQRTLATFGTPGLLFNNAGVARGGVIWENTVADWEWVMGVNVWGLIHGLRTFVPMMLEQNTEGHIINTASVSGLYTLPYVGLYQATKHAVVAISESLHYELALRKAKLKTSVLCPGFVSTRFMDSDRNRPDTLRNDPGTKMPATMEKVYREGTRTGLSTVEIAQEVFKAIRGEKFYILPHPHAKDMLRTRLENLLTERNPALSRAMMEALGIVPLNTPL